MDKIQHQNEHFESISERYYSARQSENHLQYKRLLFGYMLSDFQRYFGDKKIFVLEPMCGYGEGRKIIRRYVSDSIEYEGFDYNDTLIRKIKESRPNINIYKQDVTQFKAEKKYDIIILIGGLHHVPDYSDMVVKNLSSALNEGGLFINFEPTHNNVLVNLARKIIYKKNSLFDEETEHDFSLNRLNDMYRDAKLIIYKQYYPGLLGYILWYNPDAFPVLNIGNKRTVKRLFKFEAPLYTNRIGKFLSFCTFSILKKS